MSFFELITNTQQKNPAIILIDSSGSTKEAFQKANGNPTQLVFDKFEEIVKTIPNDFFRVIFWNSTMVTKGNFKQGIFSLPHIVKKASIHQVFEFAKMDISSNCLTYPHIGFNAITNDWIDNVTSTHVYFFTDGEITGHNSDGVNTKNELKTSIIKLFKNHNNIHLHLITVEPRTIDLNNAETMNSIAGGDVFKVFKENNLTKHITEFKSFTLNNIEGYKHIDVIIPPEGFIPYEQNYFSESNTAEFIEYVRAMVESRKQDEEYLIKVIQNLTTTIRYLIKDKLPALTKNIIKTFCNIFQDTVIDQTIAEFMLRDTTQQETSSIVYSEYRKRVKEYFKQAEEFLSNDVKVAIGIKQNFITLPLNDVIITGSASAVTESWNSFKKTYPNSSILYGDVKIPVLPFENNRLTDINEQCIRQYVRAMISTIYNINAMDDYVIYIVLVLVLRVVISDIPVDVKNSFRMIGTIMMKKKRLNTTDTELEYFAKGHVPTPNDCKTESFQKIMNSVKTLFNIDCQNHTLWYALCLALNHEELAVRQLIHCNADIMVDFPTIINAKTQLLDLMKPKIQPISHAIMNRSCLTYSCIYTGKNTSDTGGYTIRVHGACCPQYVISTDGYNKIRFNTTIFCPDCYAKIGISQFEQVGARPLENDVLNVSVTNRCYMDGRGSSVPQQQTVSVTTTVFNTTRMVAPSTTVATNKVVIFTKGTVGAGKTTFSNLLKQKLELEGWQCFVTGTDKYCVKGNSTQEAVTAVKNEIATIQNISDKAVLIIDTCGENTNSKNVFGYNLSSWKTFVVTPNYEKSMLKEYLAWSLNNVLKRERHNAFSNYYLNKFSASEQVCYDVHFKKASNLFGKNKVTKMSSVNYGDVERYQQFLNLNDALNTEVESIFRKIVG